MYSQWRGLLQEYAETPPNALLNKKTRNPGLFCSTA
jgi:hypothetical protein